MRDIKYVRAVLCYLDQKLVDEDDCESCRYRTEDGKCDAPCRCEFPSRRPDVLEFLREHPETDERENRLMFRCRDCGRLWQLKYEFHLGSGIDRKWEIRTNAKWEVKKNGHDDLQRV